MSHRKRKVNDRMIKYLHQECENISDDGLGKMSVSRGKLHEYLGLTLDYTVCGQVRIMMLSYIEGIITTFDKADPKGKGTKSSAAHNNIFVVNEYCKKLNQEKVVEFYNLVVNNFYTKYKARPDTCAAIVFLITRV